MDGTYFGPRLGTKLLILMSVAMVAFPWFSYQYLSEMEDFLVDSQANAQLLTAEGISTLLNGRTDLFYELPLSPEGYEQLYAHALETPVNIDGKPTDWEDVINFSVTFGASDAGPDANQFNLILGEHNGQVYALMHVIDDSLVFRDRDILRLDVSDHARITFTGLDNRIRRIVIAMNEPGVTSAYTMDEDWRYAIEGDSDNRVQGFMSTVDNGYLLEFRVPLDLFGSTQRFGLAVADVDDPDTREITSVTGTLPSAGREAFGLALLKSPEVLQIIEGLGYSGANIQVIDDQRRVRAEVGNYRGAGPSAAEGAFLADLWFRVVRELLEFTASKTNPDAEEVVVNRSLDGVPSTQRRWTDEGEIIVAAHPIIADEEIIGTVVLKQNTDRILEVRRDALLRVISFSVLALLVFVLLILGFSVRLARRIRKLGAEANSAIDLYGRLRASEIRSETRSGDEIGDLARSISGMLTRLHQHNQFLENMPRTLRHEINNPLNALSTSLQNLELEESESGREKYLEAAKRAVLRIGMLVQNLADAASLEEALESEEFERLDLRMLVENYLVNCRTAHPDRSFEYFGTERAAVVAASDFRIEQLLDKLIDNAIDFSEPGAVIRVGLASNSHEITLSVSNPGPTIPADSLRTVFDSMVSVRANNPDNRLHFGMGLYVVRIIAKHHGGSVQAENLPNGRGVTIRVTIPLEHEPRAALAAAG
ncbi:MAG: hypothetical protein CMQ24_01555 [Gammaproteobacteria bacterium]|mgnify:CR=1 FL=1|nr:hypothetical protein [Gammaproteobacteria bacterium]